MSTAELENRRPLRLPWKDRIIIGVLLFYLVIAVTLELYWILYRHELVALAESDWIARAFSLYGTVDRAYFDAITPLTSALEIINVYVTQWLNLLLIWAIVKRRPYRYALQLTVGSYLTYSVILYFGVAHVSGYADMANQSPGGFLLYFGFNLPWLLGYAFFAYDAIREINRRFTPNLRG